jgi:hypothetical protein
MRAHFENGRLVKCAPGRGSVRSRGYVVVSDHAAELGRLYLAGDGWKRYEWTTELERAEVFASTASALACCLEYSPSEGRGFVVSLDAAR